MPIGAQLRGRAAAGASAWRQYKRMMIAVGGLSEYAAGNRAKLIRFDRQSGQQAEYALRLSDLLRRGESEANVMLRPGDVIIIPESMF